MSVPATIQKRVKKLVKRATSAELKLLGPLEILCEGHGLKIEFQKPVELAAYRWTICDIVIENALDIEIDGSHHRDNPKQVRRDRERDERLEEMGIKVLRLPNPFVTRDPISLAIFLVDRILKAKGREMEMTRFELETIIQQRLFENMGLSFIG